MGYVMAMDLLMNINLLILGEQLVNVCPTIVDNFSSDYYSPLTDCIYFY